MPLISCSCSAIGSLARILVEPSNTDCTPATFSDASERTEFLFERIGSKRNIAYTNSITGTISRLRTGVRQKSYLVQGVLSLQLSPHNADLWLPRISGGVLGAAGSGALTDTDGDGNDKEVTLSSILPKFDLLVYRESHIAQYTCCQVANAMIRGKTSNGGDGQEFIELIIVVIGQEEIITQDGEPSPWPATEPPLVTTPNALPYAFWESEISLNGIDIPYDEFSIGINNNLSVSFRNKLFPTCIRSTGRNVDMNIKAPGICDPIREALSLNETEGTAELNLSTPDPVSMHTDLQIPFARSTFETPNANGRGEIFTDLNIEGFSDQGDDEVIIQNDSTI